MAVSLHYSGDLVPLLVISAPLGDGFGLDAAARFVSGGGSGVIFITSAANAEKAAENIQFVVKLK